MTFFFFLESTCACVLGPWPWPRAFLSLASRLSFLGKAVLGLGLEPCVLGSTSGHISHSYLNYRTKSPKSLWRKCPFLALFAVSFPVFAAIVTVFFYLHIFTESVGRKVLLVVSVDTLYKTPIISSSTVLPLNLFVNLSLAPLFLFLTYGPDLGVCPECLSPRSSSAPPFLGRGRVVPSPPPECLSS